MGPIRSRNPSRSTTILLWKSTCIALVLAGCQGPRPDETAPVPSAPPTEATATPAADRVRSVAEADGSVQLVLPARPDLHPGDGLHIRDGERLIATALVTAADDQRTMARVVALTDQRRPVRPDDRFGPVPSDVAPAPEPTAVEAPHPTEPAPTAAVTPAGPSPAAEAVVATAAAEHPMEEPAPDPHAPKGTDHPEPAAAEAAPSAAPNGEPPHPEGAVAVVAAAAVAVAEPIAPAPALQPEVRARLEAERAYWELAARVLRLPAGGPELIALQQRLRTEIAAQGAVP